MSNSCLMLAQISFDAPVTKVPTFQIMHLFIVLGIVLALGAAIVTWLLIFRAPKSDISPARRVYKGHSSESEESTESNDSGRRRKKRRTRRREHRGRNPTLAETGGLPPPRGPEAPLLP